MPLHPANGGKKSDKKKDEARSIGTNKIGARHRREKSFFESAVV